MNDPAMIGIYPRCPRCGAFPGQVHRGDCAGGQPAFAPGLQEHEISESCQDQHCCWHNVDEPGPFYVVCPECFHGYPSAKSLRVAYRRQAFKIYLEDLRGEGLQLPAGDAFRELLAADGIKLPRFPRLRAIKAMLLLPFVRASKINFCQECSHDF